MVDVIEVSYEAQHPRVWSLEELPRCIHQNLRLAPIHENILCDDSEHSDVKIRGNGIILEQLSHRVDGFPSTC